MKRQGQLAGSHQHGTHQLTFSGNSNSLSFHLDRLAGHRSKGPIGLQGGRPHLKLNGSVGLGGPPIRAQIQLVDQFGNQPLPGQAGHARSRLARLRHPFEHDFLQQLSGIGVANAQARWAGDPTVGQRHVQPVVERHVQLVDPAGDVAEHDLGPLLQIDKLRAQIQTGRR